MLDEINRIKPKHTKQSKLAAPQNENNNGYLPIN